MRANKNGRVITPGQVVDRNWLVGVPRVRYYIWYPKGMIFRGEHVDGGVAVVLMTTPDHVVDQKWSVVVPGSSLYICIAKVGIFQGEHDSGGAGR